MEKQHSLRPAHREKVIEHKLVRENLTYKQRFVDIVKFSNKENVRRFVKKTICAEQYIIEPFFGYYIPFEFLFPDSDYLQNNKIL